MLSLDGDPAFAVSEAGRNDLASAQAALADACERFQTATDLVLDGALKRDDARYRG